MWHMYPDLVTIARVDHKIKPQYDEAWIENDDWIRDCDTID